MEAIMKKDSFIIGAIAIVAVALLFTGCNPPTDAQSNVTAEELMAIFKKYVEAGEYDNLRSCCYKVTRMYYEADAHFWEAEFPGKKIFGYSTDGVIYKATYNQVDYEFTLIEEETGGFKITKIDRIVNYKAERVYF
jgi:hypothetical protein